MFLILIGVISNPEEHEVVEEFFQLFKTPWEFYDPGRQYDVVIATVENFREVDSGLFVVYGTGKYRLDKYDLAQAEIQGSNIFIEWGKESLPIYGKASTFSNPDQPILLYSKSGQTIGYETREGEQRIIRIGYDLFQEILFLLTTGQPPQNALIPTLDLHIAMLRNWIVETGITQVEIPPVPGEYRFIACLTHDVDFFGIRQHFLDHSMWGFLYRATVGTLLNFSKHKASLTKLLENLKAAFSLPLVFLGLCRDPWDQFDRCLEIENGAPSTFFFIPFKNQAGQGFSKGRGKRRATKYDIEDVGAIIQKLLSNGCEIGVHGIDAWNSVESGKQELQRIRGAMPSGHGIGIRMHWLCANERTFELLDEAGYSYDSTLGYNETVGFKAGTAQVFKPIGARALLEIPLQIQDTALFGGGRMNTTEAHADRLCQQIIDHVSLYSGVLTVLWHLRSLGPERLWGDFYVELIRKIKENNGWLATASEVVDWFRLRRTAEFETKSIENSGIIVRFEQAVNHALPQLVLRSYTSGRQSSKGNTPGPIPLRYNDVACGEESFQPYAV